MIKPPPQEKDNTNTLVERTKNSRGKRNQNSETSGTYHNRTTAGR
jgi:hypothetical protein